MGRPSAASFSKTPVCWFIFFQAEDGIRDKLVTGVQTCALPIFHSLLDKVFWARWFGGRFRWRGTTACEWDRASTRSIRDSRRVYKFKWPYLAAVATLRPKPRFPFASLFQTPAIARPHPGQAPALRRLSKTSCHERRIRSSAHFGQ